MTKFLVKATAVLALLVVCIVEQPLLHSQVVTPTFVQQNSAVPQSASVASVSATFSGAQAAGDLNVAAIGWNSATAAVTSVTDTAGNVYTRAVGPTTGTGLSQSVYYARNIVSAAAGANRVTVTFSPSAAYPDLRILEYKGIDPVSPVDVTAAGSGSSTTSNSGSVTTTNAADLLFGANIVATLTSTAGTGFTRRVITSPDGDIAEDRVVTTAGSYGATATLSSGGPWVMQMVAFRAAVVGPPDTIPPSTPALAATPASPTQINLSWTASTDNIGVTGYRVERCQGAGCATFAQISAPSGTTFNDIGLAPATSYSYRVRATDAAGNLGGYSAVASTTTLPDTRAPSAPSNLVATSPSSTQINLFWTASTDDVGVTGYFLERCQGLGCTTFAQIATPAANSYSDTGLTTGTSYSYRMRAGDAAGNLSAYSATATATASGPFLGLVAAYSFDEGAGTTATDLSGHGNTGTLANTAWTTGKYGNALLFNGANAWVSIPDAALLDLTTGETLEAWVSPFALPPVGCSPSTTCSWMDVIHKDSDRYYIEASSNQSQRPEAGGVFASGKTVVFGPSALPLNTWTHLALTYDRAMIKFYVNGLLVASAPQTSLITTSTNPLFIGGDQTQGQFFNGLIDEVRVYNVALTQSQIQTDMSTPIGNGGGQPPSAPANLVASGGAGSVSLTWSASTGPNGVVGYPVYRDVAPGVVPSPANRIAQSTATSYVDTSFPLSGNYYYVVTARDPFGSESSPSNEVPVSVTADVVPPTDPSALNATAVSNSQINLSWTGSTDDVGVASYLVERCQGTNCSSLTQIGALTGTTFSDIGLAPSTSYSYRVRARDTAGNFSGYSNMSTATTSGVPAPPATPTFSQQASAVPQSTSVLSVSATFASAQTAGDLNVVIVGWNDTSASITNVSDTAGNVYTRAVGPTLGSGLSQSLYYAKNIVASAAGVNKVTVAFSPGARYPDLRMLEYSGIDTTTAVDVTAAAVGNSSTSSSGSASTTNPTDLLVGANMVATLTAGPGTGFTSRVITSPDGDMAEDRNVTVTGTYSATAPLTAAGPWVMQMVAFRAAGSAAP